MNYQKLYTLLFNGITDALEELGRQNYGKAKEILVRTQLKTEDMYIEEEK